MGSDGESDQASGTSSDEVQSPTGVCLRTRSHRRISMEVRQTACGHKLISSTNLPHAHLFTAGSRKHAWVRYLESFRLGVVSLLRALFLALGRWRDSSGVFSFSSFPIFSHVLLVGFSLPLPPCWDDLKKFGGFVGRCRCYKWNCSSRTLRCLKIWDLWLVFVLTSHNHNK